MKLGLIFTILLTLLQLKSLAQISCNFNDSICLLDSKLSKKIKQHIVSQEDIDQVYVGDGEAQELYYQILIPEKEVKGCVVLLPGTWETTAHVWNSMATFCEIAHQQQLAIVVFSINQRLTLTDELTSLINLMCTDAIKSYQLPATKFIFGGFSMGGIFSLRYAEMAIENPSKAPIKPVAVFSCDGPCDLQHVYANFQRKKEKNPGLNEPYYGIAELEKYCEGTPQSNPNRYLYYSPFSFEEADGGNAKYLDKLPVRIYADVDPEWWMKNRHVDMYDLNALDQSALIQFLTDRGNTKAEFINAFQKGVRIEGNRHPHSWSIVDPTSTVTWILDCLKG
jgi:hypothetical protein